MTTKKGEVCLLQYKSPKYVGYKISIRYINLNLNIKHIKRHEKYHSAKTTNL